MSPRAATRVTAPPAPPRRPCETVTARPGPGSPVASPAVRDVGRRQRLRVLSARPELPTCYAALLVRTGAGEDNGIDHHQNWLRFPYDSTFLRSHYLHPHPYPSCRQPDSVFRASCPHVKIT
jgi:hypothetical protein